MIKCNESIIKMIKRRFLGHVNFMDASMCSQANDYHIEIANPGVPTRSPVTLINKDVNINYQGLYLSPSLIYAPTP